MKLTTILHNNYNYNLSIQILYTCISHLCQFALVLSSWIGSDIEIFANKEKAREGGSWFSHQKERKIVLSVLLLIFYSFVEILRLLSQLIINKW